MDISDIKTYLAGPMAEVSALMDSSLKSDIALLDATPLNKDDKEP